MCWVVKFVVPSSTLVMLFLWQASLLARKLLTRRPHSLPNLSQPHLLIVDRFLVFGRNLLEQSSGETLGGCESGVFNWRSGPNNSVAPNESDETALEFLHKHSCDLRRAQFHVTTQLSGGSGEPCRCNEEVLTREFASFLCLEGHMCPIGL